jgi:hypothetical protein
MSNRLLDLARIAVLPGDRLVDADGEPRNQQALEIVGLELDRRPGLAGDRG